MQQLLVEFKLPDPGYEEFTWVLRDEHAPASIAPLFAARGPQGPSKIMPFSIAVNGYPYARLDAPERVLAGTAGPPKDVDELIRWRKEWVPQVQAIADRLESFDAASVPLGQWAEVISGHEAEYNRVFGAVHQFAVRPARLAAGQFLDAHAALFGAARAHDAAAMLQGLPNKSLERASALWDLGRFLREHEGLRKQLDKKTSIPTDMPGAEEFRRRFETMLADFGWTTDNGQIDLPNWREGSPVPLAMVRALARQADSASPRLAAAKQAARREELERELQALAKTDVRAEALLHLLSMAQHMTPNLEDHNLLSDQRLLSAARSRWLTVGRHLVQRGLLGRREDIFFLYRPEVFAALEWESRVPQEEIEERRRLQEAYRLTPPPLSLGKPLPAEHLSDALPEEAQQGRMLRGVAASAGSYRGRARIVETMDQADTLEEGDVLVVRATTPPWTPYFGVIGALVANSGGALSHGAVVAREFGIPAVVGTKNGTALIPEGAMVTVDGTTGCVYVD